MIPISIIEELICLVFSILYLRHDKDPVWKYMIWFMLITVLIETAGWLLSMAFPHQKNHWLYNIELLVEIPFVGYVLHTFLKPFLNSGIWVIAGSFLIAGSYIAESIYRHFMIYNYFTNSLVSVLFVIAAGSYFFFLLKNDEYVNLFKHAPFWMIAGIMLFYFGSTIVNLFFAQLMKLFIAKGVPVRFIIFPVLNGILYGCWSFAFRCRYLQRMGVRS